MKTTLCLVAALAAVSAYPNFQPKVPNGESGAPNPCDPNAPWLAMGHQRTWPHDDPKTLNKFGEMFRKEGYKWTRQLCMADSDGDGKTNGEELGDPNCVWEENDRPSGSAQSHPGVCDPVDSPRCLAQQWMWLNGTNCKALENVRAPGASRSPPTSGGGNMGGGNMAEGMWTMRRGCACYCRNDMAKYLAKMLGGMMGMAMDMDDSDSWGDMSMDDDMYGGSYGGNRGSSRMSNSRRQRMEAARMQRMQNSAPPVNQTAEFNNSGYMVAPCVCACPK